MKIRTQYSLLTVGLIGGLVASVAWTVTRAQRAILEGEARERLETVMEGAARIASESMRNRDSLMLVSYVMFLQQEHPELAVAHITRRGHTTTIGSDAPNLITLSRSAVEKRPVTYTVKTFSAGAAPDAVSLSTSGVSLNVPGNALVQISEEKKPEIIEFRLGFRRDHIEAAIERVMRPLIRKTLGIAGFFMGLGILAAVGLAQHLTSPLLALSAAAGAVGEGRFDVNVPDKGKDEVGALARRFNEMTGHIKDLLQFREDILHTLTHELNTPLGGLKGYLELWGGRGMPEDPQKRSEVLTTMTAAVLRMENSLGNALRLFRVSAGTPGLSRKIVWVDDLFREVFTLFSPVANSKRIRLRALPADAAECLYGDEELLRHVVTNLVSNALKYTPDGGEVSAGLEGGSDTVRFWVADTGYGIKASDLPNLFTKFYRTEAGHAGERIPGTGLGLSIAYKAVTAMGGTIAVQSELGKGSVFTVVIPKKPAASKAAAQEN